MENNQVTKASDEELKRNITDPVEKIIRKAQRAGFYPAQIIFAVRKAMDNVFGPAGYMSDDPMDTPTGRIPGRKL